jgi:hypothetical protein
MMDDTVLCAEMLREFAPFDGKILDNIKEVEVM